MQKVAVIGDLNSVIGFRGLGLTVIATDDSVQAEIELKKLYDADYGIVFITEPLVLANSELVNKYRNYTTPAVIVIPAGGEFYDLGMHQLREQVKRAVGMDILKDKNEISEASND